MRNCDDLAKSVNNGRVQVGKFGAWSECSLIEVFLNGPVVTMKLMRFAHENGNDIVLELDASLFLKMVSNATCEAFIDTVVKASSDES